MQKDPRMSTASGQGSQVLNYVPNPSTGQSIISLEVIPQLCGLFLLAEITNIQGRKVLHQIIAQSSSHEPSD